MREDHKLQAAVSTQLDMNPAINSSHIGVAARDGVVTLTGHVPSLLERGQAELVAGQVRGVKAIINQVVVELAGAAHTADEKLAEAAYLRLRANGSIPDDRLHLAVKDGAISVHGTVDWPFQLQAAVRDLEQLSGVREVRSDVEIRPPVKPERVQERIRQVLTQLSPLDAERITVDAAGSEVVLGGEVTSWHEKGVAESAAWCVPGVSKVTNKILVL
ncbi:MAG: BON domain-containing protein [Devosia sp.]